MIPLTMTKAGEQKSIKKVEGGSEVKQYLKTLGFVIGTPISVITAAGGNVIVNIKESRIAVSRQMASKIMV